MGLALLYPKCTFWAFFVNWINFNFSQRMSYASHSKFSVEKSIVRFWNTIRGKTFVDVYHFACRTSCKKLIFTAINLYLKPGAYVCLANHRNIDKIRKTDWMNQLTVNLCKVTTVRHSLLHCPATIRINDLQVYSWPLLACALTIC